MREIEILKNMPFKIWLPWKREVTRIVTYHIKSLPDNFLEKVANFGGVCFNIKKVINAQIRRGQSPSSPPQPGLKRVKR